MAETIYQSKFEKRKKVTAGFGKTILLFGFISIIGLLFLYFWGVDALEERIDFQFYADSPTYHKLVRGELFGYDAGDGLITISGNYLGPVIVLNAMGDNYYFVFLFNALLALSSLLLLSKNFEIDSYRLSLVFLSNPISISSLLAVNKEVLSILAVCLLFLSLRRRSTIFLTASLTVAFLVRWQMALVVAVIYFSIGICGERVRRRRNFLIVLALGLSALYVLLGESFSHVQAVLELSAADYEGSGFFELLVSLQNQGYYWLIWPIKAAHLMFAMGLRFDRLFSISSLYNDFWQLLHSTALLVVFLLLWRKKKFDLRNDLLFASLVYIIIFATSPIFSPRYFYPVYIIWSVLLLQSAPSGLGCAPVREVSRLGGA